MERDISRGGDGSSSLPQREASREVRNLAWIVFLMTICVRLVPAALFVGTEDVGISLSMGLAMNAGRNPYVACPVAWPPLWPVLAGLSRRLAMSLPLSPFFAIKLFPILADGLAGLVLFSWRAEQDAPRDAFRFALLWILNPISIYITAVHGNFDALPALCLLLAILFGRERIGGVSPSAWWLSIGVFTKTWPIFALPAFLWRRKFPGAVRYAAIAIIPSAVAIGLAYLSAPEAVAAQVLGYRSLPGWWGVTGVLDLLRIDGGPFPATIFYVGMALTAVLFLKCQDPAVGALAILLAFLSFTHGFGPQYLAWIAAAGLLVDARKAILYSALAGATLAFEGLVRPFTGELGQHLVAVPTRLFLDAYGGVRDRHLTLLDRLPVWIFCVSWWSQLVAVRIGALAGSRRSSRASAVEAPPHG